MTASAIGVAFGRVSDPTAALAAEGRELAASGATLGQQTALLRRGDPDLRLNSPGWLRVEPHVVPALTDGAALRALVRTRLLATVPPHRAAVARFLGRYLDLVEAMAPAPPTGAAVRDVVSHPGDAFFDAPLPLPNAWIPAGAHGHVRVDVAFWRAGAVRAVVLAEPASFRPALRLALEAAAPLVSTCWWPPADWDDAAAIERLLGAEVAGALASGTGHGPVRTPWLLFAPPAAAG